MPGLLRPLPFRGDLIAAGGVVLAVGVVVLEMRMTGSWADGVLVLTTGLPAALLLALGWRAPVEGPVPRAYVSALLLAAAPLAALALTRLADALGGSVFTDPGALAWTAALSAAGYGALAVLRASAACALLAAAAAVVASLAAVQWIFDPTTLQAYRWVLAAAIAALAAGTWVLRERRPRHAQALAIVGGLAALLVAAMTAQEAVGGITGVEVVRGPIVVGGGDVHGPAAGWELVVLATGGALVALALLDRARGVAWAGATVLAAFTLLAATAEPTLLWWPLLLALGGAGAIGAGLALRRDDATAGGGIALALAVTTTVARFDGEWAAGVLALLAAAAAAALLVLGLRTARDGARRLPGDALLVASFPLAVAALIELGTAIGGGIDAAGTIAWVALLLALGYGALAAVRGSAALALLAALAGVTALVAGAQWLFEPETLHRFRWLLLAAIAALAIAAVRLRDRRHDQAVALADAAGITALALAVLLNVLQFLDVLAAFDAGDTTDLPQTGTGWELLLLACGFGLCAFGAVDRANGPAWIGALVLGSFAGLAALTYDPSVLWWPALLIALGGGVVAAGLRPTTPAPPSPDADAPPASTTPFLPPEPAP